MRTSVAILLLALSACTTENIKESPAASEDVPLQQQEIEQALLAASELLTVNPSKAIVKTNEAISLCAAQYDNEKQVHYAARSQTEALFYMISAAALDKDAVAVSTLCSDALFLRAYASLDLGQVEQAKADLERALKMAPANAVYLSELGHIYQINSQWQQALETFQQAEEAAKNYSPPELKKKELARAKRGVGYNLIEMGKLDEAEKKFKECLEMDGSDKGARHEREYIKALKNGEVPLSEKM